MRYFQQSGFLLLFLLLTIGLASNRCTDGSDPKILPVDESYKPDKPIEFSHELHAGKHGIDCKYCHNSAIDGKKNGISVVNVCTKCHKQVDGNSIKKKEESR